MRFYDAMPAMTWAVNATQYGHGDVINELYYQGLVVSGYISTLLKLVCLLTCCDQATQFCGTDPSQDRVVYRNFIAGEIWSFMKIVLNQDCSYLPYIQVGVVQCCQRTFAGHFETS